MSKFIHVQSLPAQGFTHHGAAHRLWSGSEPTKVEVLDGEDDGPEVTVRRNGPDGARDEQAPNPGIIGQRSFRELKANPRIRYWADGEGGDGVALAATKQAVDGLSAENAQLKLQVEGLEKANDELRARLAELDPGGDVGSDEEKTAAGDGETQVDADVPRARRGRSR
jgi:hypothetical protein